MNVISIVTFGRPELLKINFEQLLVQPELKDFKLMVFTEEGHDPGIDELLEWMRGEGVCEVESIERSRKSNKCPLPAFDNIMESYRLAASETDEFVVVLEEDIIPTQDYLAFNTDVYRRFLRRYDRLFCVAHKRRPETELGGNPSVLIGDIQLTSPSCISKSVIEEYMLPWYDKPFFFENPPQFNRMNFWMLRNAAGQHFHHDGQIERMAEYAKMFTLKPDAARSMHVGVGGIHCKAKELEGKTWKEKYDIFKEIIWNQEGDKLRDMVENYKRDMCVVDPKGPDWYHLRIDTNRDQAKASSWSFDPTNSFKEYIDGQAENTTSEEDREDTQGQD